MELSKEEILGFAVDGAYEELKSLRKEFGVDHKIHEHANEVYNTLYHLYQKEHIKNLVN